MIKRTLKELAQIKVNLKRLPADRKHSKLYCFFDMIICVVKYGALPEDYISLKFCNKTAAERKKYVTQGNKRFFMKSFYTSQALQTLSRKYEFSRKFSEFVRRDWIYTGDCTKQQIIDFVNRHDRVIIKPTSSTWGMGIRVIESRDFDIRDFDRELMVEEVLVNHPALEVLNPSSLQTLRVETCIDSQGEFHLLNVLLMMGTKKVIVSNCHSGGCMAHVNIETGEVDAPAWNPTGWECSIHPSSNIALLGYKIPMMNELYEYIKKVAFVMPEARYVGWDVTITDKGEFELIEGNFCPGQCTQTCDGVPKYDMLKSYI